MQSLDEGLSLPRCVHYTLERDRETRQRRTRKKEEVTKLHCNWREREEGRQNKEIKKNKKNKEFPSLQAEEKKKESEPQVFHTEQQPN